MTRERPIFSPSRRPPPVVVAAPPTPSAPPPPPKLPRLERPQLSLVGTVSGDDERFGIFIDQTTKAALRLRIGEDYQGWKLRAVQGREVTLEYEQQSAILTLPQPATTPGQPFLRPLVDSASVQSQAPPRRD
jgi:general secretion pathway protein N